MSHRFALPFRFADFDQAGIVYYPRFLHFCHVGMEEYFAAVVGVPYSELVSLHRLGLPAVKTEVEHRRPIRYGDRIELEVAVRRVGSSSVEWSFAFHAVLEEERPRCEARVVTVLVDMDGFEKRSLPDWLRERLPPRAAGDLAPSAVD